MGGIRQRTFKRPCPSWEGRQVEGASPRALVAHWRGRSRSRFLQSPLFGQEVFEVTPHAGVRLLACHGLLHHRPRSVPGLRRRSADPPASARHGRRPHARTAVPRSAPPPPGSTVAADPSARRSTGSSSSTSRPGWHADASAMPTARRSRATSSANSGAFSSAASSPAASPARAAAPAAMTSWSRSPAKAAACARPAPPAAWPRRPPIWSSTCSRRCRCASNGMDAPTLHGIDCATVEVLNDHLNR